MPLVKLQFKPGIDKESTSYGAEGTWFDSNLIRFRKGNPEKMGGWTKLSSSTILGTGRSLHIWSAFDGAKYMGLGTESKFYIEEGGNYFDVTPIRRTVTLGSNPFTSGAAASGIVTVTDTAHGAVEGDFVAFTGATLFDGITTGDLNKEQTITQIIGANSYKIDTGGSASSGSTAGGGTPVATYQLNIGLTEEVAGTGFGSGLFGGLTITFSQTTLNGLISDSATSIILTSATDFETVSTTIAADVALDETGAITLASATSFPDEGTVLIGSEKIRYASKSGNVLNDLTRGSDGTTQVAHTSSASANFVGLILIEDELIQYTGKTSETLDAGVVRGVRGTTAVGHSDGTAVKEANAFVTWGGATSAITSQQLRLYSQDNWGEDLIFSVVDGAPYYWDKTLGLGARATTFASQSGASDAPTIARRIFVSGADRHVIAFGCNPLGETSQDLLQVRWSDQEDPVNWTPSVTNTAGGQRISSGSEIISAQKTRQEILIWTDLNLHAMRFVGAPFTFGFSLLASNTTVISPNAVTTVGDQVFWMDQENFYMYTGQIQAIPCSILKYIFTDINLSQSRKFFAASNRMFNEVMWFYVSSDASEIDRYAKFNYSEGVWDIGSLVRTAWIDKGIHNNPRAAGIASGLNFVYIQENGRTDDGSAMTSFIESGDVDIGDGEQFSFVSRIIPDIDITSDDSSVTVDYVLKTRNFPGDSLTTNSTSSISSTTQQAFLRARARQTVLRVESTAIDIAWVLGNTRLELKPDGRR